MDASTAAFPVPHKKLTVDIKGNTTDVVICGYEDHFLVIITQIGSMGTLVQARKEQGVSVEPTFNVSVIFGKREEPMLLACARQLIENISATGSSKSLVLSLGLKDHSAGTLKAIVSTVIENRLWKERPPLTFSLVLEFFLLALVGVTANQGFYILGLYYASPTFASAMQNSVPAITFLLASVMRLEQVNILRRDGLAKVLGTIASVGGATIITLYKGFPLLHTTLTNTEQSEEDMFLPANKMQSRTLGCIFLLGHCLSWAGWLVFQASALKRYPAKLSLTSFTCFFGLLQFLAIAALAETHYEHWKITTGEELFTILYAGIVSSGVVTSLQTWCIHKGGPVCVAVFQPVQTILVAIMAALFLGDQLYSGGIVGTILITLGLYSVLWGKTEELKMGSQDKEQDPLTRHLIIDQGTIEAPQEEDSVTSDIP